MKEPTSEIKILAQRYDCYHMAEVIKQIPRQFENAMSQNLPHFSKGPYEEVIIVGMGGSVLPADVIVEGFQDQLKVPIRIVRDYQLPSKLNDNQLLIVSSFSGSTEEPLNIIEGLPEIARNIICVTTGGQLLALAKKRDYPLVVMNVENELPGFQPRSAVGYFVTYFARILESVGVLPNVLTELSSIPDFLRGIDISKEAENAARSLKDKIPVIYCDESYQRSIARITKIKINENSKKPAFYNALPEANHNEMIGFSSALGTFGILYFRDKASHPRINERFEVMQRLFEEEKLDHVSFLSWDLIGDTKFEKIISALAFSEQFSYNLAILDRHDPTPVELVEKLKKALSRRS